jgi:alanine dehydrogenase
MNTNPAGGFNVSKTSTFEKSLNVKNVLYGGVAGVKTGKLVL